MKSVRSVPPSWSPCARSSGRSRTSATGKQAWVCTAEGGLEGGGAQGWGGRRARLLALAAAA